MRISTANFFFEKKLWTKGYKHIAGVDEVGRGCFAGPVVAAAVVFQKGETLRNQGFSLIDDSKKLTRLQREKAEKWIKKNAITWGIGEASASLINRIGMGEATKMAFRRAVKAANSKFQMPNVKLDFLLIDAFYIPYLRGIRKDRQSPIIKGDEKSISIAAASIVAKVYRDKLMISLSEKSKYKKYGWERNKGYGTIEHQKAILKYGATSYHRSTFIEKFLLNLKLKAQYAILRRKV